MPGYRWMYYATGLPGWMRFGFSPGWIGRSPTGLGPCATFLLTGAWGTPQAQAFWDAIRSGNAPTPWGWTPVAGMSKEEQLQFLRQQADMLSNQIEMINKRISELEKEE